MTKVGAVCYNVCVFEREHRMAQGSSRGKLGFSTVIAYGFGDVGCNFSWMFVGNFLIFFYT